MLEPPGTHLALRQTDQGCIDFADVESDLEFLMQRINRLPTACGLWRATLLIAFVSAVFGIVGASIARSRAGIPVAASLPIYRPGDRRLSRLCPGSYRPACVRRPRRGSEYALADRGGREGQGPLGAERLRSVTA